MCDNRSDIPYLKKEQIKLLLKYPGGKTSDFKSVLLKYPEIFPTTIDRYFEPFVGGGAVWLNIDKNYSMFINDISVDLIDFYSYIQTQDSDLFDNVKKLTKGWELVSDISDKEVNVLYDNTNNNIDILIQYKDQINKYCFDGYNELYDILSKTVINKVKRIRKMEIKKKNKLSDVDKISNIEGALKAGYYTYIRFVYNKLCNLKLRSPLRSSLFYFLRDYCYSSMFRYNDKNEFNVPYGGKSYNKRKPDVKLKHWKSKKVIKHMEKTKIENNDFEIFLDRYNPKNNDFIFLDPPYDTEFSTYDQNKFGSLEQKRLAYYIINKTDAQFIAIMKHTEFIANLYNHPSIKIKFIDKQYNVSFMDRNDRKAEHIIVYRNHNQS